MRVMARIVADLVFSAAVLAAGFGFGGPWKWVAVAYVAYRFIGGFVKGASVPVWEDQLRAEWHRGFDAGKAEGLQTVLTKDTSYLHGWDDGYQEAEADMDDLEGR